MIPFPNCVVISRNFCDIFTELKPGWSAISVFVGLNASNEELGLKTQNTWAFTDNAIEGYEKYTELSVDEMQDAKIPLLFVSFPSTKDPNWNLHPGRKVSKIHLKIFREITLQAT